MFHRREFAWAVIEMLILLTKFIACPMNASRSKYFLTFQIANPPRFPCVIKIGHAHGGLGKVKVENPADYTDIISLVACANTYCTVEPYIDAKCDIHIQKIGNSYNAFMYVSSVEALRLAINARLIEPRWSFKKNSSSRAFSDRGLIS